MPPKRFISREQVRQIDERAVHECGMSIDVLMENAGGNCARTLLELGASGPAAIVCGKGNNAGDGFVMARHLDLAPIDVLVVQCSPASELTGAAERNFQLLAHTGVRIMPAWQWLGDVDSADRLAETLSRAEWIVDALFGVGLAGAPRPPLDGVIRAMNAAGGKKLAIDIPSGLDCDSGEPRDPTFRADHTCTFVEEKIGFRAAAAAPWLGRVHVLSIGAPRKLVESVLDSSG